MSPKYTKSPGDWQAYTGVVLAGGRSRRMGYDKANLRVEDQSLLERARALLESLNLKAIQVSRNTGQPGTLSDIHPGLGPLSGIHRALWAHTGPLLCVPVDMPLLTPEVLNTLLEQAERREVSCYYQGYYLPLVIRQPQQALDYLERQLSAVSGDFSVKGLLAELEAEALPASKAKPFLNVNRPLDWHQFKSLRD